MSRRALSHPRTGRRRGAAVVLALLALAATLLVVAGLPRDTGYRVELRHAAGLRAGDAVRVAGLEVGRVTGVRAEGDTVVVDLRVEDGVELTDDTASSVKLQSLLGQRYLALDPGEGEALAAGDTVDRRHAADSYTLERFWLDATPQLEELDTAALSRAVDTLGTELASAPAEVRGALDGMAQVSDLVATRDEQLGALLRSTRSVTDTVLEQRDELEQLMDDAALVMTMVSERRESIRLLLRDGRRLASTLTTLARENQHQLRPALRDAHRVLRVLTRQRDQLDRLLELSGPAMRFFTNATGDGPWLGVNAPYFVVPDDLLCLTEPLECR
ncbi:MCE family protein [Nocardioides ferulae]|uniref:MCE family protein n=1 Tax=Nocardioides ferulae TaxID=2340821 RepID=UPI000EB30ED5|nr:MCE family protein [Nocardioides ferulae]